MMMNQSRITPRTLSGFKDRLPKESLLKQRMLRILSDVLMRHGFAPIETPHLEYAEILTKQGSDEIRKELYRFNDHGGRDVALRFDQTVPFARFMSQHKSTLGMPFKRYAIGNVFRGERAQAGRYREFTQFDFDCIGVDSVMADAEIVHIIHDSLIALDLDSFSIGLNHRKIMNGLCAYLGLSQDIPSILRIIDKLEKIGSEKVAKELESTLHLSRKNIQTLLTFIAHRQEGDFRHFFHTIAHYKTYNVQMQEGIDELHEMMIFLENAGVTRCHIDFSIARGLGYYTGIVYETTLKTSLNIGSICSGGRYDNLTEMFSSDSMSGVGASIGIDRLLVVLADQCAMMECSTPAQVLISAMEKEYLLNAMTLGNKLREAGINTEIYPQAEKIKKQLQYANKKGHVFVVLLGSNEIQKNTLTLKCMTSGTQYAGIDFQKLVNIIHSESKASLT
jgi:histidyl-tRNA synthetase